VEIARELRLARAAVFVAFAAQGVSFSLLVSRVPTLQKQVHANDTMLAVLLAVVPIVAGVGSVLTGVVVQRYSSSQVLRVVQVGVSATLAAVGFAHNLAAALPILMLFGLCVGGVDATTNMQAVALQRRYGRSIILAFHGSWAAGAIAGSLLAAGASAAGLSLGTLYSAVGALMVCGYLAAGPHLLRGIRDETITATTDAPRVPWRPMAAVCAVMTFAYLGDSTVANAGGTYLTKHLSASDSVAALTYGTYTVTLMSGRLVGDRFVRRFGGVAVARVGAVIGVIGMVIVIAAWHPYVALLGFLILGAGLSAMVPQSFAAAGRLDPDETGVAVARINVFNYVGYLLGAPLVTSLWAAGVPRSAALVVPTVFIGLIGWLAYGFDEQRTTASHSGEIIPAAPSSL
jgi:MFS family permease